MNILPLKLLRTKPDSFDIVESLNPYMKRNMGQVNRAEMLNQWYEIGKIYHDLKQQGFISEIHELDSPKEFPDFVFCANPVFSFIDKNRNKSVVLSNMTHASRKGEPDFYIPFFEEMGYAIHNLPGDIGFEGMGDAIMHPTGELIFGGFGFRSALKAWEHIQRITGKTCMPLKLIHPSFYHLDTCFLPVDEEYALITPNAFDAESVQAIRQHFNHVIEISEKEAGQTMGLNAHILSHPSTGQKVAIIQKGAQEVIRVLNSLGVDVMETDTSEFIKSGGSVFCMKMMFY
jgi:arginine dihydrolase